MPSTASTTCATRSPLWLGCTESRPISPSTTCADGARVQSYLETLPDDYRVAVLLHDVYGLSNPEIAQLLGCSVATAKIRLHRARRRLREVLDAACAFDIDERGVLVCEPAPFSARANTAR